MFRIFKKKRRGRGDSTENIAEEAPGAGFRKWAQRGKALNEVMVKERMHVADMGPGGVHYGRVKGTAVDEEKNE